MEDLLNKESVKRVQEFITKFDTKLEILVLDTTARTAKDAATSLKCEVGAIVKSLLLRAENDFLICLISGDRRCSLNKLKKILEKKDVSMANADEVKINTGFSIGGVSPVAHIKNLDILIDKSLNRFQYVYAAADLRYDFHNAPQRQIVLPLTGGTQGENGDGSRRVIPVGGVYFGEDVTGEGHITSAVNDAIRFSVFAHLS